MENKALKNKKFFDLYKYIFSYIMAASLPLVIVIVIFGTVFTQAYQREVEANQSSSLLSAQNSVELMLSQMENIVQMIQLEEDYSYDLDDQLPKAISLQKRLRRYQLSSGYLKDILFYTHGNTSICASSSTYSLDTYADSVNKMTKSLTCYNHNIVSFLYYLFLQYVYIISHFYVEFNTKVAKNQPYSDWFFVFFQNLSPEFSSLSPFGVSEVSSFNELFAIFSTAGSNSSIS